MWWSVLLARLRRRVRGGSVDAASAAVVRWRRALSAFDETIGTMPVPEPRTGAAVRAVDAAIAELWAAERQMALHFDGGDRSTPVIWPWMRPVDEGSPQGADRAVV